MARPPSCDCGECEKCKRRVNARRWYQNLSPERRRAWVEARDPERVRAADRARYYRDHEKRRAASDAYQEANPDVVRKAKERWRKANPEKIRAQRQTRRAILRGEIVKQPCEGCGDEKVHAHHDDYGKPLDVRWLCPACHGIEHRRFG